VWVFGKDGLLDIREVKIRQRDRDVVYVEEGLKDGDRIVTSGLAVRVSGTPLKIDAPTTQPSSQPSSQPTSKPGDSTK
jgi:multidrug efflux pump subunit AcrA (membrane-fusion protein)